MSSMVHGRGVLALLCLVVAPSVCSGSISALTGLGIAVAIAFGKKKRSFDCSYSRTYVLSRVLVMTIRSFRWIVSACLPEPEASHGHPYSAFGTEGVRAPLSLNRTGRCTLSVVKETVKWTYADHLPSDPTTASVRAPSLSCLV